MERDKLVEDLASLLFVSPLKRKLEQQKDENDLIMRTVDRIVTLTNFGASWWRYMTRDDLTGLHSTGGYLARDDFTRDDFIRYKLKILDGWWFLRCKVDWAFWGVNRVLNFWENKDGNKNKLPHLCDSLRIEGRSNQKKFEKALECYNKVIVYAEGNSEKLAIGYANHSVILFEQEQFEHCLIDCNLALATECFPNSKLHVLLVRKGRCLVKMRNFQEAEKVFIEVRDLIESSAMTEKMIEKWKKKFVDEELANLSISKNDENMQPVQMGDCASSIPGMEGNNRQLPTCSPNMELQANDGPTWKHLVAVKDIKVNDVLIIEKPYASVLKRELYESHCHHCKSHLVNVVPCRVCSRVRYCSTDCLEISWEIYHKIECRYLNLLSSSPNNHLALRTLLVSDKKQVDKQITLMRNKNMKYDVIDGCSEDGIYAGDYHSICRLMERDGFKNEREKIIMFKSLNASIILCKFLKDGGYFEDWPSRGLDTELIAVYVAFFIFQHISQIEANAFDIFVSDSSAVVAKGIFTVLPLLHTSEEPNTILEHKHQTVVVKACKDIKAGEILSRQAQ